MAKRGRAWRSWIGVACLTMAAMVMGLAPASAARPTVGVFVNVSEMAALWPHRHPETGVFPKAGEPGYEAYKSQRTALLTEAFREIRRRVPRHIEVVPDTQEDNPYAVKISMWVADMRLHCKSTEFYKYLWVRAETGDGLASNWDELGVRSHTLVSVRMPESIRSRADIDSWVELWAQVPYLHVRTDAEADTAP